MRSHSSVPAINTSPRGCPKTVRFNWLLRPVLVCCQSLLEVAHAGEVGVEFFAIARADAPLHRFRFGSDDVHDAPALVEAPHLLQYSHFSPLSGAPDVPENYHTLTYMLTAKGDKTLVELSQDNNSSDQEVRHSKGMWEQLLVSLKKVLEEKGH